VLFEAAVAVLVPPVDVGAVIADDFGVLLGVVEVMATAGVVAVPEVTVPEVAAAAVDDEKEADRAARVAAAPVPEEVRTAGRRLPMLPAATHTPATFELIS